MKESQQISLDKYLNEIIDDESLVVGEVYLITNNINGKQYVGQTVSHRLNHKRYRPFGYLKRFDDHCSAARTTSSKTTYITNAIRKHGEEAFKIELLLRCPKDETDTYEQKYISKYNTLYPNGYNLTTGGKATIFAPVKKVGMDFEYVFTKKHREHQTEVTKKRISSALKKFYTSEENCDSQMARTIQQHEKNRLKLFEGCKVDPTKYDSYLRKQNTKNNGFRYVLKICGKQTTFVGDDDDEVKQRAYNFLRKLQQHDQIAGNP